MFGFSFSGYNNNLAQGLSLLKDYACFTEAYAAKNWLGRAVNLISSLSYSPSLLLVGELAQKYLPAAQVGKIKPSIIPHPFNSFPFSEEEEVESEEEVFDYQKDRVRKNQEEEEVFDSQKDETREDHHSKGFDDEAFARRLQQEELDFGGWNNHDPLSHSIVDDEKLARRLQEQYDNDNFYKRRDPFNDPFSRSTSLSDEELARFLERQFYSNQNQPELPKPSEKEVEFTEKDKQEEMEIMLKTAEGAYQILNTKGLVACLASEKENDPSSKKVTVYELQAGILRAVVAAVTKECPHAISVAALRSQRDVNLDQYLAIKFKQFSHIEEVKGTVILPGNKPIRLEGFFEVFAAPMVISSFDIYSKTSKFFKKTDRDWILAEFNKMIYCDYVSPKEIDQIVTALQNPDFDGPLLIQSGFIDHCAAVMWVGDYLLYFDRSSIHAEPGVHVYHIPNRELITDDFVSRMIKREELNEKNYAIIESFVTDLNATLVYHQRIPSQKVGNCTHATMEAVLEGLMAVRELLNTSKGDLKNVSSGAWAAAFKKVIPEHMKWSAFERKVIFEDMVSEIEEWLMHHTSIGKVDLKQTYQDVLTFWLMSPVSRDPIAVKKVKSLLEALEKDQFFATKTSKDPTNP